MNPVQISVTFWGVRGSRPVPGKNTLKYGGNTACIQVQAGATQVIFDAGTGLCNLGQEWMERTGAAKAHLLISHVHWDHIHGFPFFEPAFVRGNHFTVYGEGKPGFPLTELFARQMQAPFFPIGLEQMKAEVVFREIEAGQEFGLEGGITVKTAPTNHPMGNTAYRLQLNGHSVCYLGDHEHHAVTDKNLAEFCRDCDLLIYDATYTDEEYLGQAGRPAQKGWGHSTWQEAVKLAGQAGVGRLILFHHSPRRSDQELDEIEQLARARFPQCLAAKEGMILSLSDS